MASVVRGVFDGGLPWGMIACGALIGVAIIAVDVYLARRGSTWRAPVLAVAVGLYLPLELSTADLRRRAPRALREPRARSRLRRASATDCCSRRGSSRARR